MNHALLQQLAKVSKTPNQKKLLLDFASWSEHKSLSDKQLEIAERLYKDLRFRMILDASDQLRNKLLHAEPSQYVILLKQFLQEGTFKQKDKEYIIQETFHHHAVMPVKNELLSAYHEAVEKTNKIS